MNIVVWQGFDHTWQREPHRLNRFGSYVAVDDASVGHEVQGEYCSCMQIGRFPPDVCHAHTMVHRVGSPTSGHIDGQVTVMAQGRVGERTVITGEPVLVPLPGAGLTATAIMRGFDLESTGFSHGFQTRGFSFLLSEIRQQADGEGHGLVFTPHFSIFPEKSPDPFTDSSRLVWRVLPFPKGLEPNTPDDYAYRMTLHYSVVYDVAGRVAFTAHDVRAHRRSVMRRPAFAPQEVRGAAGHGLVSASVGMRGFGWELADWPKTRYNGRYLRRLQFVIDGMAYNPASGEMSFNPKMFFTNLGGRRGREDVRRWIAFLRAHRRSDITRMRRIIRAVRGSYGFEADYWMNTTLMQFMSATHIPVSRLYHVHRKQVVESQAFYLPL